MSKEEPLINDEAIAIVGLSGRFSGARNMDEFWQNLCNGVESISFFSEEELLASGVEPELIHDPRYVKARGILNDVEYFDAAFFGYSPKEAVMIDPQQRLFLECAWEVLEQAGYNPDTYEGLIGVYAGQSTSTYLLSNLLADPTFLTKIGPFSAMINNANDFLATRTCYKLNLKGPGITIQTACSTSLVAVHMACQGLLRYECDIALAGGASIIVPQKTGYLYEEEGIFSPDGHCRAFDAHAQGTVFGNGVGIVALKRLADAVTDGDAIYAVIRGSAINNDGAAKVGYSAPSVEGQVRVIAEAMAIAGVESESISYVETHGTGTALGDPIEIEALTQAFRGGDSTLRQSSCAIGSLKTNLGHLDTAAGIAGLIKTVLSLKHGVIPPSLHFQCPNPKIDFARSPFYVNTHLTAWKRGNTPRRAGVSSFGIGGTNAHVILEEAPPRDHRDSALLHVGQRWRIPLPTYPFKRQRYWISPVEAGQAQGEGAVGTGQAQGKGASPLPAPTDLAQGRQEKTSLRKEPDLAWWFSVPSWKRSPLPALPPLSVGAGQEPRTGSAVACGFAPQVCTIPTVPARKPCWLIFTDTLGLGTRLGEHLVGKGQAQGKGASPLPTGTFQETVITVSMGTQFCKVGAWEYTLRPDSREDYDSLLKDMGSSGVFPTHIVHLWTLIETDHIPSGLDYFETAQALGFYSLLFLAQALGEQNVGTAQTGGARHTGYSASPQPQEIAIISNNLQEVIGREVLCPARATALGVGKIAPYEYPHISFRSIDIVLPGAIGQAYGQAQGKGASPLPTPADEEQLVEQMIAELRSHSSDREVAYRGPHRWVRCIEPVRLEKVPEGREADGSCRDSALHLSRPYGPLPPGQSHGGLRQQGVYLITGGLGGIGLTLAEDLARRVKAKLVLTGRTALPAREEWDRRLAITKEQDTVASKIRQIKRLEELGSEVLVIQADVTNLQQMQAVISQVRQRFGELHGVIHTAGIFADGLIQMRMPEMAAKVLAPKVKGALVLEAVLKDVQLDFIVLCSSLAALIGELGRVDYCAANTFLDSFAFYHTAQKRVRTISINWDGWQEVGMAVNGTTPSKKALQYNMEIQKRFQNDILPQEGVEVLRRIIAHGTTSQVIVSTSDIQARLRQAESFLLSERLLTSRSGEQADRRDSGLPLSVPLSVPPRVLATQPSTLHQRPNLQTAYVAPQNETQQQIADIWQELLGIEKVGIHDNFIELGGHSLLGTQLIIRLRDAFQVDLSLLTLFEEPTVAGLTLVIVQKKAERVNDALLLQAMENVERLTGDEIQAWLATDVNWTDREQNI